jgi:hypothetical protein
MRIAIGGILHDRWTVPAYLEAMEALDLGGIEYVWTWVLDGQFDVPVELPGNSPFVAAVDLPGPQYARQGGNAEARVLVHRRLACLRNILRELAIEADCEALFSVDSDVIVPANTLRRLVDTAKPWAAALVHNSPDGRAWNVFRVTDIETQGGFAHHFAAMGDGVKGEWPGREGAGWDPRDNQKTECLGAGAVCLYRRDLLQAARWEAHPRGGGEDLGFALNAFAAGYRAWYLPILCRHLTVDGLEHG